MGPDTCTVIDISIMRYRYCIHILQTGVMRLKYIEKKMEWVSQKAAMSYGY